MDKQREEFEAWFEKKFTDLHDAILCGDLVAKKYRKTMWQAWQQAQKVVVPDGFVVVEKKIDSIKEKLTAIYDACDENTTVAILLDEIKECLK